MRTVEQFIEIAKEIHIDKYDYSLSVYKGNRKNIKIICPVHGEFEQLVMNHLAGHGCKKCANDLKKIDFNNMIEKLNIMYKNKYDYSLLEYINTKNKVKIICPIHGKFEQSLRSHLDGFGCHTCSYDLKRKDINDFINESNIIHSNKYDYSLVKYITSQINVKIICPVHGEFEQQPHHHLRGCRCPKCNSSKGEDIIRKILDENNINYKKQKTFKNCKNIRPLKFDFYLIDYNILIEFDGRQHFKSVRHWGGIDGLELQKIKDKIKTEYCIKNNIPLYRINYNENINEKMNEILSNLK